MEQETHHLLRHRRATLVVMARPALYMAAAEAAVQVQLVEMLAGLMVPQVMAAMALHLQSVGLQ